MAGSQSVLGTVLDEIEARLASVQAWGPHRIDETDPMLERTVAALKAAEGQRFTSVTLESDLDDDYDAGAGNEAEQKYRLLIIHTRLRPSVGSILRQKESWINAAANALTLDGNDFPCAIASGVVGYRPIVTGRNFDDRGEAMDGRSEVSFIFEVSVSSPHHDE